MHTRDSQHQISPQIPLSLKQRDPEAYYLGRARASAAKRLQRVIIDGLEGKLEASTLGSINTGLKAALAVLGLPGTPIDPLRAQQSSVVINLGVPLQQHEPQPGLRPGSLRVSVGNGHGQDPERPAGA